jgi:hypothetical protein
MDQFIMYELASSREWERERLHFLLKILTSS